MSDEFLLKPTKKDVSQQDFVRAPVFSKVDPYLSLGGALRESAVANKADEAPVRAKPA